MNFISWLLSIILAFTLGAQSGTKTTETDDELRNKVQEHLDVIVDESAAIVDEVTESIRKDEKVQDAEQFVKDVQEVAQETLDDLNQVAEDAKERIEDRFGTAEETSETGEITEAEDAPAPVPAEPADAPVAGEPVNG